MKLFPNQQFYKPDNLRKYMLKRLSLMLFILLLLITASMLVPLTSILGSQLGLKSGLFAKLPPKPAAGVADKNLPEVLAVTDSSSSASTSPRINFNLVTNFKDNVYIDGSLLVQGKGIFPVGIEAPNVVYSITPGAGIRLAGDAQNPVIESDAVTSFQGERGVIELVGGSGITIDGLNISNTGVTSFAGQTGDVTLVAGTGITISGNTISANTDVSADTGSSQNIFKTIGVSGQTSIVANSNTDTLNFAPGSGISLTTDATTKTVTIASSSILTASGFTDDGTIVRLTDPNDSVGIGTSSPLSKFSVGSNSEFQVNSTGAIAAATGVTSSGTVTFSGLAGTSKLLRVDSSGTLQVITDGAAGSFLGTDGAGNYTFSSPSGAGDITQVGSITSGAAFADTSADGQWLGLGVGAGRIQFNDTATDVVSILSANVGIGTSVPNYKLDVAGDIKVGDGSLLLLGNGASDPVTAANGSIYYRTSDDRFRCRENGSWRFCDTSASGALSGNALNGQVAVYSSTNTLAGTNSFFWDSVNSRLGIGTSTPTVALDVAGNITSSGTGSFANVTTAAQSGLTLNPYGVSAGNTGEVRFSELAANGTNYVGFKAPDAVTTNAVWTLPSADGSNNYVLTTNGAGVLSWNSVTGVGSLTGSGTTNSIPRFTGTSTLGDSGFTDNGSILGLTRDISFTSATPSIAITNGETLTITDGTNTLLSLADGGTAGNLSGIGNLTAGGTITFSALSTGIAHVNSSGVISSSAVNLASADVTGTLATGNGGTGVTGTPTNGQLLIGNGSGYTLATITNGTGVSITNGSGSITVTNTGVTSLAGTTNQVTASAATGAVTLSLPQNIDTAANVTFGTVTTAGQGGLTVNPFNTSTGNTGEVRLKELSANGSEYVGFKAPDSISGNVIWTLPSADGSNNYVLTTSGTGTLSWQSISGVGSLTGSGTTNTIPRFTSANVIGDSGLTDNGSVIGISRDISFTASTPSITITNGESLIITDGTNTLLSLADAGTAGNLSGINNFTAAGTITFSGLGTGIAHLSSGGVVSSSAVALASGDVSGVLGVANGGTGTGSAPGNGQLLIGNSTGYTLSTLTAGAGIGVTNGSGTITLANTGVTSVTGTTNQVNVSASTGAVTFSLPQDINTGANVTFSTLTTSGQGSITANPYGSSAGNTGETRFKELAANGSNYVGFKASDTIASNVIWTLPAADGSNNYVLTTDGAGVLSWNSVTGVGSLTGSGTINSIPRFTSTSTLGDSGLTDNGSIIGITRDISFTASTPSIAITNGETFTITDGTNTLLSLADGGTAGNLSGIGNLTAGGTITFSGLGTGIAHFSSGGVISSSAVNLASADVTGILGVSNGGTGTNSTPANGQLLIGNGTGYTVANLSGGTGIGITNASGSITIANTGVTSVTGTTNQVSVSGSTGAVTFSLPQDIASTSNVTFNSLTTNGQGAVVVNPFNTSAGNTGETRFKELAANGTEYVGFKAPDSVASSIVWTLPNADGSNNYVLSTNGSGVLSWAAQSSGLGGSGTTNTIPRFTSSTTIGDSGLTDNGSVIGITRDISFTASTPSIAITNGETFSITDGTNTLLTLADGGTVGNLSGIGNLTASGTVTFLGLGTGIAHFSSGGVISSSAVDLASADVTGILGVANGGTGTGSTPTNGQLLIGNGSGYSLATIANGTGISVTNGSGTITLTNTGVTSITGTANQVTASASTGAVTLSLPQNIATNSDVVFNSLTTNGQGAVVVNPFNTSAGNTGELRFKELAANGSNYVGFKAADTLTANQVWTLPSADGSNNYVLTTNGSGVLSWNSISGSGAITGSGTTNTIPRFTGTNSIGDSGLSDDGSIIGISRDISFTATTPSIAITDTETFTITDGTNTLLTLADAGTSGNLSSINNFTAGGTITFSGLGTGIAHLSSGGVISSSAVNLASADVTGTLTINKGGTGVSATPTNGQLLIGNGTGYTLATLANGTGIGITNGSGTITIANTGVTSVTGTSNQVSVSGSTGAVTFSLPQNIDTAADVTFNSVTTSGQGGLVVNPFNTSAGNTGEIRFRELAANGSNYVGFKAADNLSASQIWTLPSADGSNNYVLTTNGSGVLSWNSISGAGAISGSGTNNTIPRFTGTNTIGDSGLTDNGSVIGISRDISFTASTPSIAITNGETLTITDGTNTILSLADGGTVGNLSGIGNLTASGTITFSGLGTGIAHFSSGGVISSSAINLASADVTGTLGIGNGGTGVTGTPTNGQLLIGNGSGYTLANITTGTGIGITNGSGTINLVNTGVTSVTGTTNQVSVSGSTGAVTFSLPQDIATSSNVSFGSLTTSGQAGSTLNPYNTGAGNTGEIRFKELAANGSNYVGFKAGDSIAGDVIWTLPSADGSNNYVLTTNGTGVLSWNSISGAGAINGSGTTNTIPRFTGSTTLGDSGLTDDGSLIGITRDISFTAATPNIAITNGETLTITDGTNTLLSLADAGTAGNLSSLNNITFGGIISGAGGNAGAPTYTFTGNTTTGLFSTATNILNFGTNGTERARIDGSGFFGIGTSAPATRLDVLGANLNTDADNAVGIASFTQSVTKNDTNTRTFYGVNIKPTLNTGASNSNTTYNIFNIESVNTSTTGLTTNLFRAADGSITRFLVQQSGNIVNTATTTAGTAFQMNYNQITTGTGTGLVLNGLTSGNGLAVTSSATGITGNLALISASADNAAITGNILKIENPGATTGATTLLITNGGTGKSLRINDDGTDTDATPFIVDSSGNVGIGTLSPLAALDVNGNARLQAQGEIRFADSDSSNYVGFKAPANVTSNQIWTLPSSDGSNNYVLSTNGSGVLTWSSVSGVGSLTGSGTTNYVSKFSASNSITNSLLYDDGTNVGIGTSTPNTTLDVNGSIQARGQGEVRFADSDSSNYVGFKAASNVTSNQIWTLPSSDGSNNYVLSTNGSGVLTWSSVAGVGSLTGSGTTNSVPRWTGTNSLGDSGFTDDGSVLGITRDVSFTASTPNIAITNGETLTISDGTNTLLSLADSGTVGTLTVNAINVVNTTATGSYIANGSTANAVQINPYGTSAGNTAEVRFQELAANGTNYTGFKAPDNLAGNVTYTLPTADGSSTYVLSTNGGGVLSWVAQTGGITGSGTTNTIPRFTSSTALGDSGLTDDGSVIGITRDISFTASTPSIAITNAETFTITDGTNTLLSLADGGTVGNLSGIGNLTASGTITFSGLGTGIAHFSSGGVISSSAVNLASADVTGTLAIGNGGTGVTGTPTNGQLLIGNGSGYTLAAITGGAGIGVTNGAGTINIVNTGVTSISGTTNQVNASASTGSVTLSLPQNINTTANVNFGSVTTSGQGGIVVNPYNTSTGNTGEVRFQELAASGSNYVGFKAADTLAGNVVWTLPSADGSNNYVLTTDGAGITSWQNVAGIGAVSGSGTTNTIPRYTGANTIGDSGLTDNGSVIGITRDISFTASTPSIAITNGETFSITDGTNTLLSLADGGTVGNLSGIGNLTASGTITFSGLGTGIAHFSSGGVISSSAVNLASADVTGTLGIGNGGTGVTGTPTNGQLLIGNGSGYTLANITSGTGIGITNGSGTINLVNTGVTSAVGTSNQVSVSGATGAVTFSLPQDIATTSNVNFGSVTTSGQAALTANPFNTGAGQTSEVRFKELAANGSNYVGFKAADNLAGTQIWTLPSADGSNNYVLTTNGSGVTSWQSVSGTGAISGSGTTNTIPRFTASSTIGDSGITDDGSVIGLTRDVSFSASTPSIAITDTETFSITDGTNTLLSLADGGTVGNLSGIGNLTASGTITFSGLGTGIAHFSSGGVISSSAVNLASADVSGTLTIGKGGTGVTGTPTNGQLLIGNGSGYTLANITGGTGIGITNGSGTINVANTGVTSVAGTSNQVNVSGATGAVTFSLPQNIDTAANVNFGSLTLNTQGSLVLNPFNTSAGNTAEARFGELAANGSNYVGFKAPDNIASNVIWTLPAADGSNNYVLTTNGSGVTTWQSVSGTGAISGSGTTNTIPRFTASSTIGDSGLTDNGTNIGITRDVTFTASTPSIAITNTETFSITDGTNTLLSLADGGTVGNLSGIGNLTASGTITFNGLGTGIAHFSSGGVISSSAVNLASADVTGTLGIGNGGTGVTGTPTNGQLLIGNGSGYTLANITGGTGIGITNGSGTINIANTGVTSVTGTTNQVNVSGSTGAVTFSLPQDINTTANVNFGSVTTSGQGAVVVNPYNTSAGNTGEVRFQELAANGSNYVGFKAADTLAGNQIWTLPSADGSNNYVLTTNGSGVTSWQSVSGTGAISGSGTSNTIPRFTASNTIGDSGITDDGSVIGITRDITFTSSTPSIAITNGETLTITDGTNTLLSLADGGTAGNLSGIGNLTASGTVTFSGLGTGIAHFSSGGVISSSAVNLASGDITGTLGIGNGGTGVTGTPTNGQLLIGNGSGYTLANITGGTGIGITNGSGTINIANTGVTSVAGTTNQVTVSGATGAVTFSLPQDIATNSNVNFGSVTTSGQAAFTANPFNTGAGQTSETRFKELAANGSNYVGFKAADNIASNVIWTLPSADGSNNYVLTTDGAGVTSWSSVSGLGGVTGTGTTNTIPRFTSSTAIGDSGLTDNGSVIGISRDISFTASTPSIAITNTETFSITDGTNTLLSLADGGTVGNLSGIGNLTASGTITFSGLGTGIAHFSSGGVISSSAVNLASADVTGTLGIGNGGTGVTGTPTNGQLLIGNGSGYTLANITTGTGIGITNGSGTINLVNTGVTSVTGTTNQVNVSGSTGAVTFSLPQSIDTAANVSFGSLALNTQGALTLNPFNTSAGNTAETRFKELAANGSNYVGFKAPDNIASNVIWTLPSADGSNNYVLATNGTGTLSWQSLSSTGGITGSGTINTIPRFTSTSAIGDSGLTDNGTNIGITRDITFSASTPSIAINNAETFSITDGTNTLLSLADGGTVGNLSGIGTLSASGAVTLSNYGTGIAHFNSGGLISSSAVNLASADVTGTLGVGNGGTGTGTTFTQGSAIFAGASGIYAQDNSNYFYDATNHYLGLGNSTPATRLDVTGITLNTDADLKVGSANFTTSLTKNDTNTRTFYGLNIKPTINTGTSNTNTTFNVMNIDTTNTTNTGVTTNLLKLAYGGTQRLLVGSAGDVTSTGATTTTTGFGISANSLTTGTGFSMSSTSTGLTTGNIANIDWSPGSVTSSTGDLLKLSVGANGTIGNLLNLVNNGSSIFSVSQTAFSTSLPASFTAAGDTSMSYDLAFTNQTASSIKSNAPLTIDVGESWESNDLTLKTYNSGRIVLSGATSGSIATGTTGTQLNFSTGLLDAGGYLISAADSQGVVTGGASYNGSNWIAKATTASLTNMSTGTIGFYANTGLTVGNSFTPTQIASITSTGLGVGVVSPTYATSIRGSQAGSSIASIVNTNTTNSTATNVLRLGVGTNSTNTLTRFVVFYAGASADNNGTAVGHINLNNNAVNYATTGADYGEYFDINEVVDFGDIVAVSSNGVMKSDSSTSQLLGVVSDSTGFTGNSPESDPQPNQKPVGLMGQIRTKVDTSKGPIHKGDFITASMVNRGVGAKADGASFAIGQALEDYNGSGIARIKVFVSSSYTDPKNIAGKMSLDGNGYVNIPKLKAEKIAIGTAGSDLETVVNTQTAQLTDQANTLASLANVQTTSTTNMTALTDRMDKMDHDIATMSAALAQVNNADVSHVASIEAGLASLEQRTTSLEENVASLSAKLNDLVLSGNTASGSGALATSSATLDELTVANNANINNLGITGTISAGNLMIEGLDSLNQTSINTLGGTLKIQSLAIDNVEFEAGKITMDTTGNMNVEGSVTTSKLKINTSDVLGASAGKSTMIAGQTSIVINTTAVKPESLIFVTATSKTGQVLSVSNQVSGTSFTVNVPAASAQNINFNWWIVDSVTP